MTQISEGSVPDMTQISEGPVPDMTQIQLGARTATRSAFALSYDTIAPALLTSDIVGIGMTSIGTGIGYHEIILGTLGDLQQFISVAALVIALTVPLLHFEGHYRAERLVFGRTSAGEIASTWIGVFLFLSVLAFGLKSGDVFSRGWISSFFVVGLLFLISHRLVWVRHLRRAAAAGGLRPKKAALIGSAAALENGNPEGNLRRRGFVVTHRFDLPAQSAGPLSTGLTTDRLETLLKGLRGSDLDEVLIVGGWSDWLQIRSSREALRVLPFRVRLVPDENLGDLLARPVSHIGELPALELQAAPLPAAALRLKRCVDVVFSLLGFIIFSPIMAVAALAIRIETPGPALFRQTRTGFNGRRFKIYKFRTMRVAEDGDIVPQAKRGDPRVTRIGRLLRRTSIDELPQLLNVLMGDMSLVGPRPHAVAHDDHFDRCVREYAYRQHVKPGITGWAQVNGCRGETPSVESMARRVKLDHWYIANWSFWLDMKILMLTVAALITDRKAY